MEAENQQLQQMEFILFEQCIIYDTDSEKCKKTQIRRVRKN